MLLFEEKILNIDCENTQSLLIMRMLKEIGECPECGCSLMIYKTKNTYRRFGKCENVECDISYGLPKAGSIETSGLKCPKTKFPVLIIRAVGRNKHRPYSWGKTPCFDCTQFDKCNVVKDLVQEFKEEEKEVYNH